MQPLSFQPITFNFGQNGPNVTTTTTTSSSSINMPTSNFNTNPEMIQAPTLDASRFHFTAATGSATTTAAASSTNTGGVGITTPAPTYYEENSIKENNTNYATGDRGVVSSTSTTTLPGLGNNPVTNAATSLNDQNLSGIANTNTNHFTGLYYPGPSSNNNYLDQSISIGDTNPNPQDNTNTTVSNLNPYGYPDFFNNNVKNYSYGEPSPIHANLNDPTSLPPPEKVNNQNQHQNLNDIAREQFFAGGGGIAFGSSHSYAANDEDYKRSGFHQIAESANLNTNHDNSDDPNRVPTFVKVRGLPQQQDPRIQRMPRGGSKRKKGGWLGCCGGIGKELGRMM